MYGPLWTASASADRTAPTGAAFALALTRARSRAIPFAPGSTAPGLSAKPPAHRSRPRVAGTATSPDAEARPLRGPAGAEEMSPLIQNPRSARRDHGFIPLASARIADASAVGLNAPAPTPKVRPLSPAPAEHLTSKYSPAARMMGVQ